MIREEHEKRRNCRQSRKGYQSVTFRGRLDAFAAVEARLTRVDKAERTGEGYKVVTVTE
jgi:S-adenosylmethionine hydrolase